MILKKCIQTNIKYLQEIQIMKTQTIIMQLCLINIFDLKKLELLKKKNAMELCHIKCLAPLEIYARI